MHTSSHLRRTYGRNVFGVFSRCYGQENAEPRRSGRLCAVTSPRTAVVLLAAGSGTRVGAATNKVLLPLAGRPVLQWSLRTIAALPYVERLVVVHRAEDRDAVAQVVLAELDEGREATLVDGGATRHDSEWRGLRALQGVIESGGVDVVAIHDAARPLADAALFDRTVETAHASGAGIPVRNQAALLGRDSGGRVPGLVTVQTPQAFRAAPLLDAYRRAESDGFTGTDTAACVARYTDVRIRAVDGPATNLKITFAEDVALVERLVLRHPISG
jgi:2-C-methyl-D-erythritol 4-phosphate cytidylyltransferase